MPNINRAAQRRLIQAQRQRLPHSQLVPIVREEREDWSQFYAHAKAKAAFVKRPRPVLAKPPCPHCDPHNPRLLPMVI